MSSSSKKVWGFDMSEARWSAFKGKNMFDKRWPHFRRERLFIYQIAQTISIGATIPATISLSKYRKFRTNVQEFALAQNGLKVEVFDNDIIMAEILTLTFCAFVSSLFGLEFIMLVLWPSRTSYPKWYNRTRIILPVIFTIGLLAASIVSTLTVFTHSGFITGASAEEQEQLTTFFFRPPLKYMSYPANVVSVCFLWVAWVCAVAATVILIIGVRSEMNGNGDSPTEMPSPASEEDEKPTNTNECFEEPLPS
ncbi:hypothetical protein EV361DRAFT_933442 [Lentinula raphanica]|nr:hypothetical protein F5880DRAFT_1614402 [Lentinula raphanica]KAJ3966838.1 hypothetical protein EV361DRAFT_933442 [Lentinula raphanica]